MSDGAEMAGPSVNEIEWKEEENIPFMVSDIQPGFRFLLYNFPSMGEGIFVEENKIFRLSGSVTSVTGAHDADHCTGSELANL